MCYIPDFISPSEEDSIRRDLVAEGGWTDLGKRKLKHFGGVPDPGGGAMTPERLPGWAADVCQAVGVNEAWGGGMKPNQLLCNEYAPRGGIGRHQDGPMFEPRAAILSMGAQATIRFWAPSGQVGSALLRPFPRRACIQSRVSC